MVPERSPSRPRRQSIPLQDLSPPPELGGGQQEGWQHQRAPSWRNRMLPGSRRSFTGTINTAYSRVQEGSPPERDRLGLPHITTPRNAHQPYADEDDDASPVNPGEFQAAMGGFGLSFEPGYTPAVEPPGPSRPTAGTKRRSTLKMISERDDASVKSFSVTPTTGERGIEPDNDAYFSPQDSDQTPLTDNRFAAPISGSLLPPPDSGHNRMGSRLGDNLPHLEAGRAGRPISSMSSRSLGPPMAGSTLSRAGTMLRKASQRVVNLSNEPDAIDTNMRAERSGRVSKEGRMEAPPALPAMQDYAVDDRPGTSIPIEKTRSNVSASEEPEGYWPQPNPLRGKSLGIFGPDNRLRLWLCEVLVHPVTEPAILILIVIQTIVLAADAASAVEYGQRPGPWKPNWSNAILLILFVIYTLEIVARIIVSGLVKNAEEYSTTETTLGPIAALKERIHSFFSPQRQMALRKPGKGPGPDISILRSFGSVQVYVDQPGHTRQAQRVRLARRAFLRHGFNRLDFIAVISYWVSFVIMMLGVEYRHHFYLFRMLSCLRILRLLGLTGGTSVS